MIDIVLSLVFAAPLLIIMIYPSMKFVELLRKKYNFNDKTYDKLTVIFTIVFSVIVGILLHVT